MVHARNYDTASAFVKVIQRKLGYWLLVFRTRCRRGRLRVFVEAGASELSMGWVDPYGLVWIGSGSRIFVFSGLGWVMGLKWQICKKTRLHNYIGLRICNFALGSNSLHLRCTWVGVGMGTNRTIVAKRRL